MTVEPPERKRRLSVDEVLDIASEIANDASAGPDRFRAMRMLTSMEAAAVRLPEPEGDGDVERMLSDMMRAAGTRLSQLAYRRAFPTRSHATDAAPRGSITYGDATNEQKDRARKITSLKILYRTFPETKQHGVPKGFPSGRSFAIKAEWCRNEALRILVEREIKARQEGHDAMTAADTEIRGAMDGSVDPYPATR